MIQYLQILLGARLDKAENAESRGATAVEYGLLVALIAAIIVSIVATLGGKIATAFSTVSNAV